MFSPCAIWIQYHNNNNNKIFWTRVISTCSRRNSSWKNTVTLNIHHILFAIWVNINQNILLLILSLHNRVKQFHMFHKITWQNMLLMKGNIRTCNHRIHRKRNGCNRTLRASAIVVLPILLGKILNLQLMGIYRIAWKWVVSLMSRKSSNKIYFCMICFEDARDH